MKNEHPLYGTWAAMKRRCYNPNVKAYRWYGARGIGVCKRWNDDFFAFLSDMGPHPQGMTLERINGELGYSPENCRWATRKEQANNTRRNRLITFRGKTQSLSVWSRETGIPWCRIKPEERAA